MWLSGCARHPGTWTHVSEAVGVGCSMDLRGREALAGSLAPTPRAGCSVARVQGRPYLEEFTHRVPVPGL